jgi:general secretion pathway protein H
MHFDSASRAILREAGLSSAEISSAPSCGPHWRRARAVATGIAANIPSIVTKRTARGFSLMEILVVIVILAVVAGAVSIAVAGAGGERALTREAERAQALIEFACERAQLSGRVVGISLSQSGYRFSRFEQEVWLPYREETLRTRSWPANFSISLARDDLTVRLGEDFPERPQLLCYASGELTAFRLELALPDLVRHYRIDGQCDGQVLLTAVDGRGR